MKFNILLPGTGSRWQSGGLEVMLKLSRLVAESRPSEVVTYAEREPDLRFLDDVLESPGERSSIWVFTTGIDVPMLLRRLSGRPMAYFVQETGWEIDMPPGIPLLCATRYAMAYWSQHSLANPVYLLPVALDPDVLYTNGDRDIDVLYIARKTSPYLHDELIPSLRDRCRIEEVDRFIDRSDLLSLFNRSKVYVYDSSASFADGVLEGIGLQPLEALVCGCTVFSNLEGGMADYLDPGVNFHRLQLLLDRDRDAILEAVAAYDPSTARETGSALARRYSEAALKARLTTLLPEIERPVALALPGELSRQVSRQVAARQKASQPLYREIHTRGRVIAQLQNELREKVDQRDRIISDLQQDASILQRDAEALASAHRETLDHFAVSQEALSSARTQLEFERAGLELARTDLQRIYDSRLWKAATHYWNLRKRISHLVRRQHPDTPVDRLTPARPIAPTPPPPIASERARHAGGSRRSTSIDRAPLSAENTCEILCLPIIDWDFRFQRPQQMMSQFARAGHRVFYVAQRFRRTGPLYEVSRKAENVYEVSLRGRTLNIYRDTMGDEAGEALFLAIDALRKELALDATVVVVELPFWWSLARRLRVAFGWPIVYDCMDDHAGFSTNNPGMLADETELLSAADLAIASSRLLEDGAKALNSKVMLVRNGCDYEHFAAARRSGAPPREPVIGYYGAIADWFDADLVAEIAERRPDWKFILVGSTFSADLSRLSKLRNVSFPGEKPYAEIPDWLSQFDVAIIPFKRIPLTEATNPVKAYEMLAAGTPVVAVPLPEITAMAPHVRVASTADDFITEIEAALAHPGQGEEERRAFARANTWAKRFEILTPAIGPLFPRVSVVVVTFGNRDLNRVCLDSVDARTAWPNTEVIVVDNGSTDGTPELLRRLEEERPGLRVILNDENLGFAAACNQGLREATGDVLILLNNDTLVARGWLTALVRHLHRDPTIGLIGPVTNAIGNEAMIPVGYQRPEEMPSWAAEWIEEHDGETFEIPMLAMFCIAMRRSVYEEVGPLDERFGVGMFEDDDYTRRVRDAGFRVVCARDSFVHHWMRASFAKIPTEEYQRLFERNRRLFEEKWRITWTPHRAPPGTGDAN